MDARITLPNWIWGGDPGRLLQECDYRYRPDADRPASYLLRPMEAYLKSRPHLLDVQTLAGPGQASRRYQYLATLKERVDVSTLERAATLVGERRRQFQESGQLIDAIKLQLLSLHVTAVSELPVQAAAFHKQLLETTFKANSGDGPFTSSGVHVIATSPKLLHRVKLPSILLRIQQDTRLSGGDVSHIEALAGEDQAFSSSTELYNGIYLMDAYLGPLLAAGSPGVWAFSASRTFGPLVFTLGTFMPGTSGEASEFIQLLSIPGAADVVVFPKLSPEACTYALNWWADRLDLMFGVLSDFSVFTDAAGDYVPSKHLAAVLTVEQVFRRTTSLLVAHRDLHGRRALLFTVLDSLEKLTGLDLLKMCELSHARATLERLERTIPPRAAEVLLPTARRGVAALEQMQDGFFLRRQSSASGLELHIEGAPNKAMSVEEGVARYLKMLRDATHGHGTNRERQAALTNALLVHHDGRVPHDIGLLAYVYVLDILAEPTRLRRPLYRGGQ